MFDGYWYSTKDGDARAYFLFTRHYSFHLYQDNRRTTDRRFVGPCRDRLILLGRDCLGLFVWKQWSDPSGQHGIYCSIFHNESLYLSSDLILEAEEMAILRWGCQQRFYTYVDATKIESVNPGYCFKRAGWTQCKEKTKINKLIILEKLTR